MASAAAKLEAFRRLHAELERDESGAVDQRVVEKLFAKVMPKEQRFNVHKLIDSAPRNSDGKILLEDFLRWIFLPPEMAGVDFQTAAFRTLLTGVQCDASGCVSRETLERLLNEVFRGEQILDVTALIAQAPRNHEGNILYEEFLRWVFYGSPTAETRGVVLEAGVQKGSWIVGRLREAVPAQYVYAQILSVDPFRARRADGQEFCGKDLVWAVQAKDDGWLEPFGDEWQQPGRVIFLRLLEGEEWVSARVADRPPNGHGNAESIYLPLQGVFGLPGVHVEKEVGMLFTPHEECQEEFARVQPGRGGSLVSHLSRAFVSKESKIDARRRWVLKGRVEIQYPMRCVWVHPKVKEQAMSEFVHRCQQKKRQSKVVPSPEVVLVLGPPAAGKSSIQRLPREQVPSNVRETVASLEGREEVNNDNLTDCMPGFSVEFQVALGIPELSTPPGIQRGSMFTSIVESLMPHSVSLEPRPAGRSTTSARKPSGWDTTFRELSLRATLRDLGKATRKQGQNSVGWAMQWLTYALFHHGPVRDSLAWDIIKLTVVDAEELPVYYSSVMAGNAIPRTVHIVRLGGSAKDPVPHPPRRTVGFWPYTSQETRIQRARKRHADERRQKKLLGGNADSNLVNLHYHASQAEANIKKMLEQLNDAEGGEEGIKHFLIIDNGGAVPRVLFDWAADKDVSDEYEAEMQTAARAMLEIINEVSTWNSLCNHVHRIAQFFLPESDELLQIASGKATHGEEKAEAADLLPLLTAADEAVFARLNYEAPVLLSEQPKLSMEVTGRGLEMLTHIPKDDVRVLKERLSELRKFCVVIAMQDIRNDSDESSESESESDDDINDRVVCTRLGSIDESSELVLALSGDDLELGKTLRLS